MPSGPEKKAAVHVLPRRTLAAAPITVTRRNLIDFGSPENLREVQSREGIRFIVRGQRQQAADAVKVDLIENLLGKNPTVMGRQRSQPRSRYVGAIAVDKHNADILPFEGLREQSRPGMSPHDQHALRAPLG